MSLHIDFNGHSILFDAGSSGKFTRNAALLGIDDKSVGTAVLSHHHFDHGNGLRRFFEVNPGTPIEEADRIAEEVERRVHSGVQSGYCYIHVDPALPVQEHQGQFSGGA